MPCGVRSRRGRARPLKFPVAAGPDRPQAQACDVGQPCCVCGRHQSSASSRLVLACFSCVQDLENIPFLLVLAWGSYVSLVSSSGMTSASTLEAHCNAHIVLFTVAAAARVVHTILYTSGISKARTYVWFTGLFAALGAYVFRAGCDE